MSKELLQKQVRYQNDLKTRLTDKVPAKHVSREKEYRQYLQRELKTVTAKVDYLKMNVVPDKK